MHCINYILQNVLGVVGGGKDWALVIDLPAIHSCNRLKKIDFSWHAVLLDARPAN